MAKLDFAVIGKPVDHSMNTQRGEKDFENGGDVVYNGSSLTDCFSTNSTFEPRDEVKGDIARMIFYMDLITGLSHFTSFMLY